MQSCQHDSLGISQSQRITVIPPLNPEGLTLIEYELVNGSLHYRRTVNGVQSDQVFISSNESVSLEGFDVARETATALDDEGNSYTYTKSVTATLTLSSGDNSFRVTASVCPRRNLTY